MGRSSASCINAHMNTTGFVCRLQVRGKQFIMWEQNIICRYSSISSHVLTCMEKGRSTSVGRAYCLTSFTICEVSCGNAMQGWLSNILCNHYKCNQILTVKFSNYLKIDNFNRSILEGILILVLPFFTSTEKEERL
jgi:hypothetical protein